MDSSQNDEMKETTYTAKGEESRLNRICEHAELDGEQVACALPAVGRAASLRMCRICRRNTTRSDGVAAWPLKNDIPPVPVVTVRGGRAIPADPAVRNSIARQQSGCRGCGDAPLEGL